jgi:hypothetical protein
MGIVSKHGELWARNKQNLKALKSLVGNPYGIYVLRDGSMPLYIGTGKIASRISKHRRSKSKGEYWDHFSWYEIRKNQNRKDIESLLLRLLPFYLRTLNRQRGRLSGSQKYKGENPSPEFVRKPQLAPRRHSSKRKKRTHKART